MTGIFITPVMGEEIESGSAEAGFRSFAMFWLGGIAGVTAAAGGQPIILRTATVPFLGGSLRRGGW